MSAAKPAPLRLAVLGAGMASAPHLASLAELAGEVQVAWVAARSLPRLQAARLPAGARLTTRLEDILEDPQVQAVLVLTPPNTHLPLVRQLAGAGKHVLLEKPLETDVARARALIEACESAGVHLAVMLQHRMRQGSQRLRELLQQGALGEMVSAAALARWWRPQSYYDQPGRGTRERDGGGVLLTQAIHTLDLLLWLIGMPERVSGSAHTSAVHRMECEDTAAALLHYRGGAVAVVQATTAAYPGYAERIEINGTLATATLEAGELKVRFMNGESLSVGSPQGGGGADPMAFDHGAHCAVLRDFVRVVRDGGATGALANSGRSALAVQLLIEAILDSARSGQTVALDTGASAP